MKYFLEVDAEGRVPQQFQLPEAVVRLAAGTEAKIQLQLPTCRSCVAASGDAQAAAGTKMARRVFGDQVTSDYAGIRLRLQSALAAGEWRKARNTADTVQTLVRQLGASSYRARLDAIESDAKVHLSGY